MEPSIQWEQEQEEQQRWLLESVKKDVPPWVQEHKRLDCTSKESLDRQLRLRAFEENYKKSPLNVGVDEFIDYLKYAKEKDDRQERKRQKEYDFDVDGKRSLVNWKTLLFSPGTYSNKELSINKALVDKAYKDSFGEGRISEVVASTGIEKFLLKVREHPSTLLAGTLGLFIAGTYSITGLMSNINFNHASTLPLEGLIFLSGLGIIGLALLFKFVLIDMVIAKMLKTESCAQGMIKNHLINKRKRKFGKALGIGSKFAFKYENRVMMFHLFKVASGYLLNLNARLDTSEENLKKEFKATDLSIEDEILEFKECLLLEKGYEIRALKVAMKVRNKLLRNLSTERRLKMSEGKTLDDVGDIVDDKLREHHDKLWNMHNPDPEKEPVVPNPFVL